jgi:galactose mutarotase-like enzyme
METLVLTHISEDNIRTEATFLPAHGMNLISYKKGDVEIIDQATKKGFDERSAGLGPLIGPHFHRRRPELLPKIDQEFPQSAYCKTHGIADIFSHGVARYVPWKFEKTEKGFKAQLSGKDTWYEVPLSTIEGQNFQMTMEVELNSQGLRIQLSVVSDTDSVVGIHYFYQLPNGKGLIKAQVKDQELVVSFPSKAIDSSFRPADPDKGIIWLETEEYTLKTEYDCISEENSWQLYHPENATFVCIEPISAQDPRHPNLSVSSISINLKIDLPRG